MTFSMKLKTIANGLISLALLFAATISKRAEAAVEFEEDFALPIAYLSIVIDSGAAQDPMNKLGLANIASRMLLRGTQQRNKLDFNEQLNRLGGEFEVDVRDEGTVYRGAILSENIEKFLKLVEETLVRPKFTAGELSKLKKEVEGEILERKSNDRALVQTNFYRFLYGNHPYGNPVIGTRAGVKSITYKDIVNYYVAHFGGKTIHLFGTGAVKKEVIESWFTTLSQKLGALHPEADSASEAPQPRLEPGRRTLLVDKPKATQSQVLMGGAGIRPENPAFYPVTLANYSFGGHSFQARLMQEIRVKRGWTYGVTNSFRYGRQPKHYAIHVFPKTKDTAPAIELAAQMLDDWTKNGITPEEFEFAKSSLVNNAPFNYDTSKKRLENATSEYIMNFPHGFFREFAINIAKVAYDEIKPSLRSFFNPNNIALTVVGDAATLKEPLSKLPGFAPPVVKNYLED